jgi:hypothetical protein
VLVELEPGLEAELPVLEEPPYDPVELEPPAE